jgi:hypothetical protein
MTILPTNPVPHTTTRLLTWVLQEIDGLRDESPNAALWLRWRTPVQPILVRRLSAIASRRKSRRQVNTDTLAAIEAIKQLKARYFRLLDTKQWDEWAGVFTADLDAWIEDTSDINYSSRDQFVASVSAILADAVTVHHGHMPEIEVTSPDTARGIWAMFDYVRIAGQERSLELKGYGHYHEEYRKGFDGQWRISSLRLHRLRVDFL